MHNVRVEFEEVFIEAVVGTSNFANNSTDSPACRSIVNNSFPEESTNAGVPGQDGLVQSRDVVDSCALPRFSILSHAKASDPCLPYPLATSKPVDPSIEIPLVLRTSIGSVA